MDGARRTRAGAGLALPRQDRLARRCRVARAARRGGRPRAGAVAAAGLLVSPAEHGGDRRRGERPHDVLARPRRRDRERPRLSRARVDRARRRARRSAPCLGGAGAVRAQAPRLPPREAVRPQRAGGAGAERTSPDDVGVAGAARPARLDARGAVRRGGGRPAAHDQPAALVSVPHRPWNPTERRDGAVRGARASRRRARRLLRRARRRPAEHRPAARLLGSHAADQHGQRARRRDGRGDDERDRGGVSDRTPLVRGQGRPPRPPEARARRPVRTDRRGPRVLLAGSRGDRRRLVRPLLAEARGDLPRLPRGGARRRAAAPGQGGRRVLHVGVEDSAAVRAHELHRAAPRREHARARVRACDPQRARTRAPDVALASHGHSDG